MRAITVRPPTWEPPNGIDEKWEAWLASRPYDIQLLVAEFPPMTEVTMEDKLWYVVGYREGNGVLLSLHNPVHDYELATSDTVCVCSEHLRPGC